MNALSDSIVALMVTSAVIYLGSRAYRFLRSGQQWLCGQPCGACHASRHSANRSPSAPHDQSETPGSSFAV